MWCAKPPPCCNMNLSLCSAPSSLKFKDANLKYQLANNVTWAVTLCAVTETQREMCWQGQVYRVPDL